MRLPILSLSLSLSLMMVKQLLLHIYMNINALDLASNMYF